MARPLRRGEKFQIRLSEAELRALEELRVELGLPSRTAVIRRALRMLVESSRSNDAEAA